MRADPKGQALLVRLLGRLVRAVQEDLPGVRKAVRGKSQRRVLQGERPGAAGDHRGGDHTRGASSIIVSVFRVRERN